MMLLKRTALDVATKCLLVVVAADRGETTAAAAKTKANIDIQRVDCTAIVVDIDKRIAAAAAAETAMMVRKTDQHTTVLDVVLTLVLLAVASPVLSAVVAVKCVIDAGIATSVERVSPQTPVALDTP